MDAPAPFLLPSPLDVLPSLGAAREGLLGSQRSFAAVLSRADHRADDPSLTPAQRAHEAAEQLVASSLIQPMLQSLRQSGMAAPPFAPTPGEKQIRALMDAELAQRIARASNFPLVDRLARDMLRMSGADSPRADGADRAP